MCVAVLNKGQVLTDYYRLMNRHGGYVWLQTCATIICNAKNVDEQNIIAINYVLRYAQPPTHHFSLHSAYTRTLRSVVRNEKINTTNFVLLLLASGLIFHWLELGAVCCSALPPRRHFLLC